MKAMLPSFIIIGAAKSATTWITHKLQQNPAVFLPGPEPHYFSTEFHRRESWYQSIFQDARPGQVIGEKSADYLAHPEAPRRIAQRFPDIRLIVQLRNPIERAYSDYCMLFRRGTVGGNPENYLVRSRTSVPRFLDDGLYGQHLARFMEFFPREQLQVVLYDDIRAQPEAIIADVSRHIGVEPWLNGVAASERVKYKDAPMLPLGLRKLLQPMKGLAQPLRDKPWFIAAHRRLARPVEYPPLTGNLRAQMLDYYADDISNLSRLLGRDMGFWLNESASA